VLQCVAVWCTVLQCGALCCSVVHCVAVWCTVLQCGAVCCSVVHCVAVWCTVVQCGAVCCSVVHCVAVRFGSDTVMCGGHSIFLRILLASKNPQKSARQSFYIWGGYD